MTLPSLQIVNGPGQRDLELVFIGRNLGAEARFTLFAKDKPPLVVGLKIYNLDFVACRGPIYNLGGQLPHLSLGDKEKLPPFNWVLVKYNTEERLGTMEFSNGE